MNAIVSSSSLKLVKIGNSTGVVLPRRLLGSLGVDLGDTVIASVEPNGALTLRRSDEAFEQQMATARKVMARRTRALRELGK